MAIIGVQSHETVSFAQNQSHIRLGYLNSHAKDKFIVINQTPADLWFCRTLCFFRRPLYDPI
jgi:hypothetical protein